MFTYLCRERLFAFYLSCLFEHNQAVLLLFMGVRNVYSKPETV